MTIVTATGEPWEWDVPERDEDGRIVPEDEDDGEDAVTTLRALWRTAAAGLVVAVVVAELVIRGRVGR